MCNQCPTVGEFICGILRCGRCHNTCKCENRCENKCEHKCEHAEKCFEFVCKEKKATAPCEKHEDKDCGCSDCVCKFF